jgi:hypothetical protein
LHKTDLYRAAILAVLAFLSLTIVIPNHILITANNRVGLALDWQEVQGIAQTARVSIDELVEILRGEGARYMVVREDTLGRLKQRGQIQLLTGWELRQLLQMLGQEPAADTDIPPRDTYILTGQQEMFERLRKRLTLRYPDTVRTLDWKVQNTKVLALTESKEQLALVGIGVSPADMEAVKKLGLEPVPAWSDGAKTVAELELDLGVATRLQPTILLPGPLPALAREKAGATLAKNNISQGMLEFDSTPGAEMVAAASGYRVLRVYERPVHTIYQEYLLAVRDRNVRFVVLHLPWQIPPHSKCKTLLDANVHHVQQVVKAVTPGRLQLGVPQPFLPPPIKRGSVAVMVALAPALMVDWQRWPRIPWMVFCAGLGLGTFVGTPAVYMALRKGAALAITALLPAGAMFWALRWAESRFSHSLKSGLMVLLASSGLTLVGGIVVQGLLGDIGFLLKLHTFSGIKVAYLITFLLVLVEAYRERWQGRNWWRKKQIAPRELLVLALLALAVWVLFNRSGNTSIIPIPAWELKARSWLEQRFFVRPRTKEFLVGHPAMMLATADWTQDRFYRPQLLVLAATGQASLINTFVHLHTPIAISLVRSVLGLVCGIVIGTLLLIGEVSARRGKQHA